MINKKSILPLFSLLFFSTTGCYANINNQVKHPFYAGAIAGYGSTTWHALIPTNKNQKTALLMSTPVDVQEGGATWGALLGYEFTPYFAVEANYMRYPNSTVYFTSYSLFSYEHDGKLSLTTKTDSISVLAKIMLQIPRTEFRVFSSAGIAALYREDLIIDDWRASPTFGVGVNYNFTDRIMGEVVANYTAGFGESQLSPADAYYPFLYSITARLAYRF
ncbi:outer membrane beta-barrel protein [Legionella rowbothamii]|uniref:outer membrane beta-barrel protein n=1 Tax=Legionella rowbothamii TaxID=96229 RepID=UPI001054E0CA|nr:outer membrane beta-barrel protein [Legionella rowbothamii]